MELSSIVHPLKFCDDFPKQSNINSYFIVKKRAG